MEKKFILTLKSRTEIYKMADALKKRSVPCSIVTTPREGGNVCGLSLEISPNDYTFFVALVSMLNVSITSILVREGRCGSYKYYII